MPDPDPDPDPVGNAITVLATQLSVEAPTTVEGYTFEMQKTDAGNTLNIKGAGMAKIVFTLAKDAGYRYTDFTPSTGSLNPAQAAGDTSITWTGNAADITFTVGAVATMGTEEGKPGQIRFTKIEIYPAQ